MTSSSVDDNLLFLHMHIHVFLPARLPRIIVFTLLIKQLIRKGWVDAGGSRAMLINFSKILMFGSLAILGENENAGGIKV